MKPENKNKVKEAIMDELNVSEAFADKLAEIMMDAVQRALVIIADKLVMDGINRKDNP